MFHIKRVSQSVVSNSSVITEPNRWTLGVINSLLMLAALNQTISITSLSATMLNLGRLDQLQWVVTAFLAFLIIRYF